LDDKPHHPRVGDNGQRLIRSRDALVGTAAIGALSSTTRTSRAATDPFFHLDCFDLLVDGL